MAFKRARARILERSTTSGGGPYTLAGAVDGSYNTFASFCADGDTTEVSVIEPGVACWTGLGTFNTGPNRITLTTVEETFGTFGAGTKEIMAGPLAARHLLMEDLSGAITTGGSSTAYTVASLRVYDTLTRMHGKAIAFSPHATNGQTVTLNVDGLGAKPLRPRPGYELQSNALIAGTPYTALYNHTDGVFYLFGFGGTDTPGIPIGACIDYFGTTAPSTAFALAYGQALSRTTYAPLFALYSTTYGNGLGDGLTFSLPDLRGRVLAGKDDMGGSAISRLTSTYFGTSAAVLGAVGGAESHQLITAEMPAHNHPIGVTDSRTWSVALGHSGLASPDVPVGSGVDYLSAGPTAVTPSGSITGASTNTGGGGNHKNIQPTIISNKLIRVL